MLVVAGASLLATGCVYRERTVYRTPPPPPGGVVAESPGGEVEVYSDMPAGPPAGEVDTTVAIGAPTVVGDVWVPGGYIWVGGGWRWRGGYWGHPPYRGAVWIGPRFVVRGGHRYWAEGRWGRR